MRSIGYGLMAGAGAITVGLAGLSKSTGAFYRVAFTGWIVLVLGVVLVIWELALAQKKRQ